MTILSIEKIEVQGIRRVLIHNKVTIRCDTCDTEKIFFPCFDKRFMNKPYHYCCKQCFYISHSDGVSAELSKKKYKEKTGKEYPMQVDSVKQLTKDNIITKYGVENISQLSEIKEKKKETMFKNYGVTFFMDSPEILEKIHTGNLQKYGCINPMNNEEIKNKLKISIFELFGVDNVSKLPEIKARKQQTCFEHYGVVNPFCSEEIKSKIDYKSSWEKAHQTKKTNGTYKSSTIEEQFYEQLCSVYSKENIEHPILANGWSIDFFIRPINTYIQFDGIYWHGLDRPIEDISNSTLARDRNITKKYYTDIQQNIWFTQNNLKLIRITDKQYRSLSINEILNIIN